MNVPVVSRLLAVAVATEELFFAWILLSVTRYRRRFYCRKQPRRKSSKVSPAQQQLPITRKMSFRKRNIGLSAGADRTPASNLQSQPQRAVSSPPTTPGVRPSPDDGRPTTSTGSPSLDSLLAGHGGLPIGKTLLLEENGTTDFAGALLRYYAAEGVVQDQKVHVIGMPEQWGRTLPGLIGPAEAADDKSDKRKAERMKIAWRYERLGEFGAGVAGARGRLPSIVWLNLSHTDPVKFPQQVQVIKAYLLLTMAQLNRHFVTHSTSPNASRIRLLATSHIYPSYQQRSLCLFRS